MEEPGMVRRHRFYRTGLLTFVLLATLFFLSPQRSPGQDAREGAEELAVRLESSPERPVLGGFWRIVILVDHPVPEEVTVIPPELPPSLTFAQSRKETRFIGTSAEQGRRWTLAEFLFVPQSAGEIILEPFEALVGDERVLTPPARTTVGAGEGREARRPHLAWDPPPRVLGIGEAAELTLRVLDGDPQRPLHRLPLSMTAPMEALLEEIPLTGDDLEQGLALRLRLIPLEGSRVSLGPFSLGFETLTLEAPAISIALSPPPAAPPPEPTVTAEAVPGPTGDGSFDGPPLPALAFPEVRDEPFPLFRRSYRETLAKARDYWGQSLYAEALGELRRGERDLLSGPALAATRRAAERLLDLPPTEDEKWRPRSCFVALIILSFCLLLLSIVLPRRARRGDSEKRGVTSLFFHGYTIVIFALLGIIGFGVVALARSPGGFEGLGGARKWPGNAAVALRSCVAYRVPDLRGAISARWTEGQPVRVRSASGAWAYVESSGGEAGWVNRDSIIVY
jgi:hypothetical protein